MLRSHSDAKEDSGMSKVHDASSCSPSKDAANPHGHSRHCATCSASERSQRLAMERSPLSSIVRHESLVDSRFLRLIVLFSLFIRTQGIVLTTAGQPSASALHPAGAFVRPVRASPLRMDLEASYDMWGVSSDTQASLFDDVAYHRGTDRSAEHAASSVSTTATSPRGSAIRSRSRTERPVPSAIAPSRHGLSSSIASTPRSSSGGIDTRPSLSHLGAPSASLFAPSYHQLHSREELLAALSSSRGRPAVLVFASKACRTCRRLQPKLERAATRAGADFFLVHHDASTDAIFREHGVRLTPTVQVYDAVGTLVDRQVYSTADLPHLSSVLESVAFGI